MAEFFQLHITEVFFLYGLSFFSMGLVVMLEASRSSQLEFAKALHPLSWFGLIHGSHEWFEMYLINMNQLGEAIPPVGILNSIRVTLLAVSFYLLIAFGVRLIVGAIKPRDLLLIVATSLVVWLAGLVWVVRTIQDPASQGVAADVYTRYALAIPGAALTTWGLILQRRKFTQEDLHPFGRDILFAAAAFALYGGIGQVFASPSPIFLSRFLNTSTFVQWFGFPVQVFRMLMAGFAAVFIIRSLRAFEVLNQRQIDTLRAAKLEEERRLELLSAELLHRTVKAQETERQRIARELHDETGQTLTALGMGLHGLTESIPRDPERAAQHARQLQEVATSGLVDLQRLVSGLHPPQLDDLGLSAALRWYAGETMTRFNLNVSVTTENNFQDLSEDVRIVLFRIAQEAITNAVRHAQASAITIHLKQAGGNVMLVVDDDGRGFDAENRLARGRDCGCWGLIGMIERAALVGGTCAIHSKSGHGTRVEVLVPLDQEAVHDG